MMGFRFFVFVAFFFVVALRGFSQCGYVDDFPNHPSLASPINVSSSFGGTIEVVADRDVFRALLLPLHSYVVTVTPVGLTDVEVHFLSADGVTEVGLATSAGGGSAVLSIGTVSVARLVYFDVRSFSELFAGGYTFAIVESNVNDVDLDDLPDDWEDGHGLDSGDGMGDEGYGGDKDGDGFTNGEEFQLGTHPDDAGSYLYVKSVEVSTNDYLVTWPAVEGGTYRLSSTPEMLTPFTRVVDVLYDVPDGDAVYRDVGVATNDSVMYSIELLTD